MIGLPARFAAILSHRIAAHLDAVRVVNQPVEDAVGGGGIADLFVPAGRPAVARSGSSSASDSGLRRSPRSRGVRVRREEPWPSRRSPAHRYGSSAPANYADCRRRVRWPGRETMQQSGCKKPSNHRGTPSVPMRKRRSFYRRQLVRARRGFHDSAAQADFCASARITLLSSPREVR